MSEEKENEMIDESSSSNFDDYDDFWSEREKHNIDHVPVDVRQYVISLGQAGIHGPEPIGFDTKIEIRGPPRTNRCT